MPEQRVGQRAGHQGSQGHRLDQGAAGRVTPHQIDITLLVEAVILQQAPEGVGVEQAVDAEIRIVLDPLADDPVADHQRQALGGPVQGPLVGDPFGGLVGQPELPDHVAVDVADGSAQAIQVALELQAQNIRRDRVAGDGDRRRLAALQETIIADAPDGEGQDKQEEQDLDDDAGRLVADGLEHGCVSSRRGRTIETRNTRGKLLPGLDYSYPRRIG